MSSPDVDVVPEFFPSLFPNKSVGGKLEPSKSYRIEQAGSRRSFPFCCRYSSTVRFSEYLLLGRRARCVSNACVCVFGACINRSEQPQHSSVAPEVPHPEMLDLTFSFILAGMYLEIICSVVFSWHRTSLFLSPSSPSFSPPIIIIIQKSLTMANSPEERWILPYSHNKAASAVLWSMLWSFLRVTRHCQWLTSTGRTESVLTSRLELSFKVCTSWSSGQTSEMFQFQRGCLRCLSPEWLPFSIFEVLLNVYFIIKIAVKRQKERKWTDVLESCFSNSKFQRPHSSACLSSVGLHHPKVNISHPEEKHPDGCLGWYNTRLEMKDFTGISGINRINK